MSVVKGQTGGTHRTSTDECSGGDRNTLSTQFKPETRASSSDMGGEQKFPRSSREMRNMAEKMRRDKLNNYINELAGIVPLGSGGSKRLDKTSTLRLAANYIRMHKILVKEDDGAEKVPPVLEGNIAHNLAEAVGGFLLVVTSTGRVVYVTEAVDQFFGHSQVDLLGHSIYNVIHPDDHEIFQQQLIPRGNNRVSFFCRMMEKALTRNDPGRYEIIHIVGQLKPIPASASVVPCSPSTAFLSPDGRSSSDAEENYESDGDVDNQTTKAAINRIGTHILVSFVRVVKDRPITELSLVESTQDEYITRHGLGGSILYTDHRISFVTGLMPGEVVGTSAFAYMHPEDRVWSIVAQKLMFTSTQGQGIVSYRLQCRDGSFVTLRSRGYLEVNKQTGQVESFVCINTVVSIREAEEEIKNQRRKLLPVISSQDCDDHLKTISSSLPPELIKDVMPLLTPAALRQMAAAFEISEVKSDKIVEIETSSLDMTERSEQSLEAPVEVMKNSQVESDDNPYQSKPKKVCNSEKSEASSFEFTKNIPEADERTRKSPSSNVWHSASDNQASVDDFKTVVTKNFSFEREQFKQAQAHNEEQLSPAASPQVQICASSPQYGSKTCYQSPVNQYDGLTDQKLVKGHGIDNCQPDKDMHFIAGDQSPYGNGSELSPGVVSYSVDGSITSAGNQKKEDCSSKPLDQMNIVVEFPKPEYSPLSLKEGIDSRILYRQGESQNRAGGMPSPGSTSVRSERNVSPSGTYPFHTISDGVLPDSSQDSGISVGSYANHQEWGNGSSVRGALLPKCMNTPVRHGHHSFQQLEFDGSVNPMTQSGPAHHRNIHPQISPDSMLGTKDHYHQVHQQHHQHHKYNQQQLQQQQHLQQQQQHQKLQLQQQCQQQQQEEEEQQQQQQHFHHQPIITATSVRHNFNFSSSPKFDVKVQGHDNPVPQNYGAVTNWQSRTGVIPCHSSDASGENPDVFSSTNLLSHMESEGSHALQCDTSFHLDTANPCSSKFL